MTKFYKDVGARIENYRKINKLSAEELANRIGVTKKTIRRYELGEIRISHERMVELSNALNIDVNLLYGDNVQTEMIDVPLYGEISCGNGTVIFEEKLSYEPTPKNWIKDGSDYFYLTAKGDSMIGAKIHEGDILLIRRQEEVESGEIAAVVINDESLLKRVYKKNGTYMLISENPNYAPIEFDPKRDTNIRIIGKLKKSITTF
ncbi:LexA family protein [Terrihalobacillus insolitus]|uniref:LexA family protein n=1 Tax=Terrihalobacillus insolitus TaxID=2950438 RepID=UPI0023400B6D|nr:XRE family transcriptional regulator [Terrihalobacillus insolitus]MDC3412564.1 XRE family transcriptional regulator [Terrihalobacillus insolitus]